MAPPTDEAVLLVNVQFTKFIVAENKLDTAPPEKFALLLVKVQLSR